VSFLPCRSGESTVSSDDDDFISEHRRLQRTPTPYYEEAPSLMTTETMNVDDMDATDSVEGSVTDMSGRAWRAASLTCLEGLGGQRH